ncbi:hypothetical protein GJW-30_1_04239 [Variibacter gotjawalensis]|uniref:Uncharacterized protein n=1 Tax=Variibacter gotjawalensis TaxID=1333996 RepID=A0A0S3Q0H1_9BRAD|nr:hypothetical protein EV661_1849 [Variibacter gotjawalensis]BAT61679.1 hypothetical protein GJW-30_1_04239 [Variibacter gotjawalensis]
MAAKALDPGTYSVGGRHVAKPRGEVRDSSRLDR